MRKRAVLVLNILEVIFTVIGVVLMAVRNGGMFTAAGWNNLKYFTVLSNIFCGIVAAAYLVAAARHKGTEGKPADGENRLPKDGSSQPVSTGMTIMKLISATAVAVTFLMIAGFFGPLYGWLKLYKGSNFWFHLVIPVLAMVEFCLLESTISFRLVWTAVLPALVYGAFYLANNLINGTGEWPDSNDWYGFLNWGLPVGIVIFFGVAAVSFGIACALRAINGKVNRK